MELEELSVAEKAAMLSGGSEWDSRGNEKAGIPSFVMIAFAELAAHTVGAVAHHEAGDAGLLVAAGIPFGAT